MTKFSLAGKNESISDIWRTVQKWQILSDEHADRALTKIGSGSRELSENRSQNEWQTIAKVAGPPIRHGNNAFLFAVLNKKKLEVV